MSEHESELPLTPEPRRPGHTSRMRRFFLRHLPLSVAAIALAVVAMTIGLYFWASSPGFEGIMRQRLIAQIQQSVGGRVEIARFHWDLLNLEADADGVVIHGLEAPGEEPYARVAHLRVGLSVFGVLSPRVLLRELDIAQPAFHLILYPDGTTNQPHPRKAGKPQDLSADTLFNLKAGHVAVRQGTLDIEDRAASFDFQNRFALLDFQAKDASLLSALCSGVCHVA
jgi:translocation and assembly module TamB